MPKSKEKNIKCSFCGKPQTGVKRIIAGPGVYICDECIGVCRNILDEDDLEYDESDLEDEEGEE